MRTYTPFKIFLLQYLLKISTSLDIRFGVTTATIAADHGYAAEAIDVTTADGYILKMFYMPPHEHCSDFELKKPALLMHGLGLCSDCWLLNGPNDALGFLLVDDCHPVYLGNSRSNVYGRRHLTLNTSDAKFWQFSYYEIGYYDVTAMISVIRERHNNTNISYVGHSEGCTDVLVFLSERQELNDWIETAYLLAPATYTRSADIPPIIAIPIGCFPESKLDFPAPIPQSPLNQLYGQTICFSKDKCITIAHPYNRRANNLNQTLVPSIGYNHPAGFAMNEAKHFLQGVCESKYDFKNFNYGTKRNRVLYGADDPPPYDIESISSRIVVFYGDDDIFTRPMYTALLCAENSHWHCTLIPNYNHYDLIWSLDVKKNVNLPIVNDMF